MAYNNTPYFSEDFYVGDRPVKSTDHVNADQTKKQHSVLSTMRNIAQFTTQLCYLSKFERTNR